jgi:Ca-activated chloride channel family protein
MWMHHLDMVVPLAGALAALLLALLAEWLHARRVRRMGRLAFGPDGRARRWTFVAAPLRVLCLTAMAWSLLTLLMAQANPGGSGNTPRARTRAETVFLVLDYSPSMMIEDAGPDTGKLTRKQRMRDVVKAIVDRMGAHVDYTLVCFYTRTYPICEKVFDRRVVRNVLDNLPVEVAMETGPTDVGRAVNESLQRAAGMDGTQPRYRKNSITYVLVTDGDTQEMPALQEVPDTIRGALVLGVGDTGKGVVLNGHLSRQEPATLQFIARHLAGEYVDVNTKHVPSAAMSTLLPPAPGLADRGLSRTGVALVLFAAMAALYALLPVGLEFFGCSWRVAPRSAAREEPT